MIDVVSCYTRAQAVADGVLVDVSPLADEAGFQFPVALTRSVWQKCVAVPREVSDQDETGRLWDILVCLAFAVRRAGNDTNQVTFRVGVRNRPHMIEEVKLKAVCGPGDAGEPVLTVMLPDED